MNKVINWFCGSFIRTIGRFLAFVVIGMLVASLISANNIKFDISSLLGIQRVYAEQIVVPVNPRASEYYFGIPNWSGGWSLDSTANFARTSFWTHDYVQEQWLQFGGSDFTTDIDYLEFSFMVSQPNVIGDVSTPKYRYCSKWEMTTWTDQVLSNGSRSGLPSVYTCKAFTEYDGTTTTDLYSTSVSNLNLYFEIEYTNGNKPMCTVTGSTIICPTNHLTPYKLHIYSYFDNSFNTKFDFEISRHVRGYYIQNQQEIIDSINSSTTQTINNQNQNTQIINSTLTDTNTTQASDDADSFFSGFSVSDNGGLSGIITAPLSAIQSITSSSCSPLVLSLPFINQNLTLPCMRQIYLDNFGGFMTLYDIITLGIISYWIIVRIFNLVKDFKNPEHDEIEVVDL